MNTRILLLTLLFIPLTAATPRPDISFGSKGGTIMSDRFGNIYTYSGSTLTSYTDKGTALASFSLPYGGTITDIDVANPFKILVLSASLSTLTLLDNTLTPVDDPIPLSSLQVLGAVSVCASFDNGFWLLDAWDFSLNRYDAFLRNTNRTELDDLEAGSAFLTEQDHSLYLYQPSSGLRVFDRYGTQVRQLPLTGLRFPCIRDGSFYGLDGRNLISTDLSTMETDTIHLPRMDIVGFCKLDDAYAIATPDSVHIFQHPEP